MKLKLLIVFLSVAMVSTSVAFDLKDLGRVVDKSYKCKSGDKSCKKKERIKAVAKVAAVAVAATIITKMVINYRSKRVAKEEQVVADYTSTNASLPADPVATEYVTKTLPGNVVEPGKEVIIQSDIVVVPGTKSKTTLIEERIAIYDNEDNTKELKSFTKPVNKKTKRGGRYQNEFSFTLPEGLPQGVYPIKTELLLNGKVVKGASNDIQLVISQPKVTNIQVLALN